MLQLNFLFMKKYYNLISSVILLLSFSQLSSQWSYNPAINTPVCTNTGEQIENRIMEDGTGGCYIVWRDYRNGAPDIYLQRLNKNGVALWTINGVAACTNTADQSTPSIVSDMRGGCIIAWSDWRSFVERDLYAQRVDSNGNMMWTIDGVVVTNKPEREHSERMCSDGAGGAIVCWEQQSNVDFSWGVWCQRIDSSGNQVWQSGGALIVWTDFRNGIDWNIMAQRVDSSGNMIWQPNGVSVSIADLNQTAPKNCSDGNGGTIVCFQDTRNGNTDIYAQHLFADGSLNSINHIAGSYSALVFPNPFENQVHLINQNNYKAFSIEDLTGKIILCGTALNGTDLSGLAAGTYILSLTNQENQLIVQKIVKE